MTGLPDFGDYKLLPSTTSCGMDRRYFNKVFENYPALIPNPLVVEVLQNPDGSYRGGAAMEASRFHPTATNLVRVEIRYRGANDTQTTYHSNLLLITGDKVYWYEPEYRAASNQVRIWIKRYLKQYLQFNMEQLVIPTPEVVAPGCNVPGFCLAYVIKVAYDLLRGQPVDISQIGSFALAVERRYGALPAPAQLDFGWFDQPTGQGLLLGGLGGAAIGGLAGGWGGAAIGGLTGAALGGLVGAAMTPQPQPYYGGYYGGYPNYGYGGGYYYR